MSKLVSLQKRVALKTQFVTALSVVSFLTSCGKNPFASSEKKEPAEDATIQLEKKNPQKAIDILEAALTDDPGNFTYVSVLSMAYAQRAGVDPITLAQKAATQNSTDSNNPASMVGFFPVLPAATAKNIADVDYAISLIQQIPQPSRIAADTFKIGIFLTASMALKAKQLDTNGDGVLSQSELLAMTPAAAIAILSNLSTAVAAFANANGYDTTSVQATQQIQKLQDVINSTPGATPQEKLQNYLATH